MEKIKSFQKDHNNLSAGFYFSGMQKNISTFDLRFKKPNEGDFLSFPALHTIEHILATLLRNSQYKENIIYFGPMGCRTGFYLLTTEMTENQVFQLLKETFAKVEYIESIPGNSKIECGNYLEHNLDEAKLACKNYLKLLDY